MEISDEYENSFGIEEIELEDENVQLITDTNSIQFPQSRNTEPNPFSLLSDDSIAVLTKYLSTEDLLSFEQSCRRFWYICQRDELWTSYVYHHTETRVYTKQDAIRKMVNKRQEDTKREKEMSERKKRKEKQNMEDKLDILRDILNCFLFDFVSYVLFLVGYILMQLIIDGIVSLDYWVPFLFCFPLILVYTIIPIINYFIARHNNDSTPPTRSWTSPLQTIRYHYMLNPRGVGLLTEPFVLVCYILLFGVSLGMDILVLFSVLILWSLILICFGLFTFTEGIHLRLSGGLVYVPLGICLFVGFLLTLYKLEDYIDISWHLAFAPFYIILVGGFVYPFIMFLFFLISALCHKKYDFESKWTKVCCIEIFYLEPAMLKSLFLMLISCLVFMLILLTLITLAIGLDGEDDVTFYQIFLPLDLLSVALPAGVVIMKLLEKKSWFLN